MNPSAETPLARRRIWLSLGKIPRPGQSWHASNSSLILSSLQIHVQAVHDLLSRFLNMHASLLRFHYCSDLSHVVSHGVFGHLLWRCSIVLAMTTQLYPASSAHEISHSTPYLRSRCGMFMTFASTLLSVSHCEVTPAPRGLWHVSYCVGSYRRAWQIYNINSAVLDVG